MRLTVEEWKALPEIILPWRGEESGFTMTALQGVCPKCGLSLLRLRGEIYESFGVIEVRMGGLCLSCKHLVPCRCRVVPKTSSFMIERDGKWATQRMMTKRQIWKENLSGMIGKIGLPFMLLVFPLIFMTCVYTKMTTKTWLGWGSFFFMVLVMMVAASKPGKRE